MSTPLEQIKTCILTGQTIVDPVIGKEFRYKVRFDKKDYQFFFCPKCYGVMETELKSKRYLLQGLLLNNKLQQIENKTIHWDEGGFKESIDGIYLKKEIEEGIYPRNPKEQYDNLFHTLYHKFILGIINISRLGKEDPFFASRTYFRSFGELELFFKAMIKDELFDKVVEDNGRFLSNYQITYQGLSYYMKIFDEGYSSSKCFVAMSFQDETKPVREAIRAAIVHTGYEPIFIDEKNISSEKTINDEIIASLKKCKFCIADFSHHKNGVYFESGFALGQGKPVIYTCQDEEFKKAHFDIKPLQHIIYQSPDELKERLIHKIEAWIK